MPDEFYIGYEPAMPARMAARVRMAAAGLIAMALTVPLVLVYAEGRFAPGVFEFGRERSFEGRIVEHPYPALHVPDASGDVAGSYFWLVGPGKHGASAFVQGLDGRMVRLRGALIRRDGDSMIEVVPGSILAAGPPGEPAVEPLRRLADMAVDGEIVDSKCHLGVMKPGEGPTHRDCAVRCLLGSVPPMVVVRGGDVDRPRVPLVAADGSPFTGDLHALVGRPVSVRGVLLARGHQRFLAAAEIVSDGITVRLPADTLIKPSHP